MMTAVSPGAMSTPTASPITRLVSQPSEARTIGRPRTASKLISLPATKNSVASPKSERSSTKSDGCTHPSTSGPMQDAEHELEHDDRHAHPRSRPPARAAARAPRSAG